MDNQIRVRTSRKIKRKMTRKDLENCIKLAVPFSLLSVLGGAYLAYELYENDLKKAAIAGGAFVALGFIVAGYALISRYMFNLKEHKKKQSRYEEYREK